MVRSSYYYTGNWFVHLSVSAHTHIPLRTSSFTLYVMHHVFHTS